MGLPGGMVTFVLTDIEGSTRLFDRLGDGYLDVLEDHRLLIRAPFTARGGVEVKCDGDGFVFAFPDATGAVLACAEAQSRLLAHPWPDDAGIAVRMGIHTGHAVPIEDDYVSLALHHASRLSSGASGGQVLVSPATLDAAAGDRLHAAGAVLTSLGAFRLRDVEEAWEVFELSGPGLAPSGKAPRLAPAVRHNLPERRSSFVGRVADVRHVQELAREHRLVTLVGAGGVGKTRLAAEVAYLEADLQPDGALAAQLSSSPDAQAILTTVAGVVGVREQAGTDLLDAIVDELRGKRLFFLLDCCEHVLAACTELVAALLEHCPHVRIVATSQVPLGLAEERPWRVPPLNLPDDGPITLDEALLSDAVQLFCERAASARPGWQLRDRDVTDVVGICRQLDGIPLAIELAAARMQAMEPGHIRARLVDRFDLLTSRGAQGREATLRATVEWSYLLLDPEEQQAFAALSIFGGSFDLPAAEAVCGDILDPLCSLVYRSLVVADDRSGDLRYWMLQTLRLFAAERLASAPEAAAVRDRYIAWAIGVAAGAGIHAATLDVKPGGRGAAAVDADHDNLLAALGLCLDPVAPRLDDALRLVHHLTPYWMLRGHFALGVERATSVLSVASGEPGVDPLLLGLVHVDAGLLAIRRGELAGAEASLVTGIDLLGAADPATTSLALTGRALVAWYAHRFQEAHELLDRADDLADGLDDDSVRSFRLLTRFKMFNRENRIDEARLVGEEAAAHAARAALPRHRAAIVQNLAYTHWCRGDLDACVAAAQEALAYFELHGEALGVAYCLDNLALVAAARGDTAEAARCIGQALEEFDRIGFRAGVAESLEQVAVLLSDGGEHHLAAAILDASEALRRETGIQIDEPFRAVLERARTEIAEGLASSRVPPPAMTVADAIEAAMAATRRLRTGDAVARASSPRS